MQAISFFQRLKKIFGFDIVVSKIICIFALLKSR